MDIILATKWTDPDGDTHKGGEPLTVDDATGKQLIRDGWARPGTAVSLDLADLQSAAMDASDATYKHAQTLEATDTVDHEPPAQPTTDSPSTGDDKKE